MVAHKGFKWLSVEFVATTEAKPTWHQHWLGSLWHVVAPGEGLAPYRESQLRPLT